MKALDIALCVAALVWAGLLISAVATAAGLSGIPRLAFWLSIGYGHFALCRLVMYGRRR